MGSSRRACRLDSRSAVAVGFSPVISHPHSSFRGAPAWREPGIHLTTIVAAQWIPGSRSRAPRNDDGDCIGAVSIDGLISYVLEAAAGSGAVTRALTPRFSSTP